MDTAENTEHLPLGTCLERYEILSVLGQGGGGITYLAQDSELEREVVLKEHFPLGLCRLVPGKATVEAVDAVLYERSLQSFCREARILAALKHPSVVPVHEIFSACGTAFLAMDYVKGATLREWMQTKPEGRRIRPVVEELLTALEYLHGAGVVHRDIKPANILVQEGDKVVLIDFGAALLGDPTHTLTLVGTPEYAAPEQFDSSAQPGPRADIYALGRSLERVAAGSDVLLPRRIRRSLRKACARKAENRYASAAEWKRALNPVPAYVLAAGAALLLAGGGMAYMCEESPAEKPIPAPAANPVEKPAPAPPTDIAQTVATPPQLPKYHPVQLIHYDRRGRLIRYASEVLPPAEEAFVSAMLEAQKKFDDAAARLSEELRAGKIKSRRYYRSLHSEQKKLNGYIVDLIDDFIKRHYGDKDPLGIGTVTLMYTVAENGLSKYESLLSRHAAHPRHLLSYDEKGCLVPDSRYGTENERSFGNSLKAIQEEYNLAVQQGKALSAEQEEKRRCDLQLELNRKALQLIDDYLEEYVDEEHPDYHLTAALREEVATKNLPPGMSALPTTDK